MPEPRTERPEVLISIDIESAGPTPREFPMLSIGACLVDDPEQGFYIELQPDAPGVDHRALAVGGLVPAELAESGTAPGLAMAQFEEWVQSVVPEGSVAVFVGFNASFDWMFVADYFQRYLGRNPFGHASLDIKAYFLGAFGGTWAGTSMKHLAPRYLEGRQLSHNALADARDQAELFRAIRADRESRVPPA